MPSRAKKVIGAHAVVWFLCTLPAYGQLVSTEFSDFLQRHIGLSKSDLRKVEQGKVVTKALDTKVKSEVAIFGVILIRVPTDLFVQKFRDIEQFKKDLKSAPVKSRVAGDVAQAGKLGVTGTPAFYVNGRFLSGAQPFTSFKKLIDEELAKN